jgi:hypothetical protein
MLFFDAPEHTRLRKLSFSPAAVESLRPQVEKIVDRLFMPLRKNRQVDIIPQFVRSPTPCVRDRRVAECSGVAAREVCPLVKRRRCPLRQSLSHAGRPRYGTASHS